MTDDSAELKKEKPGNNSLKRSKRDARILDLTVKGLGATATATATGCSVSTVNAVLRRFAPVLKALGEVEDYRGAKADILDAAQISVLESAFSGNKLKKAGFLSTLQGFEILNKAGRLEKGQSTENIQKIIKGDMNINHLTGDK
jgi:hypothetical protein